MLACNIGPYWTNKYYGYMICVRNTMELPEFEWLNEVQFFVCFMIA